MVVVRVYTISQFKFNEKSQILTLKSDCIKWLKEKEIMKKVEDRTASSDYMSAYTKERSTATCDELVFGEYYQPDARYVSTQSLYNNNAINKKIGEI